MHFITLLTLPCVLALPAIQIRQACGDDQPVPQCDDEAKTWSRCDQGNIVSMGTFDEGWTCQTLRNAFNQQKRDTIPSFKTKRQSCDEASQPVPQCDDDAKTWSRCDQGNIVSMGQFDESWNCGLLKTSFGQQQKRSISIIPATLTKRQSCSGDGVPQCDDEAKTWSRCSNDVIVPMGVFGDGWSCQALHTAFGDDSQQQPPPPPEDNNPPPPPVDDNNPPQDESR